MNSFDQPNLQHSTANTTDKKLPEWSGVPVEVNMPGGTPIVVVPIAVEVDENGKIKDRSRPIISVNVPVEPRQHEEEETRFVLVDSPPPIEQNGLNEYEPDDSKITSSNADDIQILQHEHFETAPQKLLSRIFHRVGGAGFAFSAIFHLALIVFALLWISTKYIEIQEEPPSSFVSGAGGGKRGERPSMAEHTLRKRSKVEMPRHSKITTTSAHASFVLPEMNLNMPSAKTPLGNEPGTAAASSGFGLGNGGGIGSGTGIGVGGGTNFISKFKPRKVLGADLYAEKIAVYLDCSGSMKPYLAQVKQEIYDKFPDADIFEFDGARTEVVDGEILGGKSPKMKRVIEESPNSKKKDKTAADKLSKKGATLHKKYAKHFTVGSAGAWVDVLVDEGYDALVIFSDFYDGLRQTDSRTEETLYADSVYKPTASDSRKAKDFRWEKNWKNAFTGAKAPKLYLFTIGIEPQKFWQNCVASSEGNVTDVTHLKKAKKSRTKRKTKSEKPFPEDETPEKNDEVSLTVSAMPQSKSAPKRKIFLE